MLASEFRSQVAYVCFCLKKWRSLAHLQTHCLKMHGQFSNHFNCYLRSNLEYYILKKIKEIHQSPVSQKKVLNKAEDPQKNENMKQQPKLRSQAIDEKENILKKSKDNQPNRQSTSVEPIFEQEYSLYEDMKKEPKQKKINPTSILNKTFQRGRPKISKNTELQCLLSYFNDQVAILTYGEPRILFDFTCSRRQVLPGLVIKYIKSWRLDSTTKLFPFFKQTRNRLIILNTLILSQTQFSTLNKLQPPFESYYTQLFNYFLLTFVPFILRDTDINQWIIKYRAQILQQSEEIRIEIRRFLLWCRRNGDICGDVFLNPRLNFSCNRRQTEKIVEQIAQL